MKYWPRDMTFQMRSTPHIDRQRQGAYLDFEGVNSSPASDLKSDTYREPDEVETPRHAVRPGNRTSTPVCRAKRS